MNAPANNAPSQKPWYRQFWPWFIMALPATAVVAGLTTVGIAVVNQDSVVKDDWYKEGKAINLDFARDKRASELGIVATTRMDEVTGEVRLRLQHKEGMALPPSLTVFFQHPTLADADQKLVLSRQGDEYRGNLPKGLTGRFHVELGTPEWRLLGSREFPVAEFSLTHE